jgi:hypothetical protein
VSTTPAKASSEPPAPPVWLRRLWERMISAYPHRWAPTMGESPQHPATLPDGRPHPKAGQLTVAGDTWARGLAGFTGEQMARGLEGCINSGKEWPPSLTEFKMRALGIPSFSEVAADSARENARRMPFTIAVFQRMDPWSYRHAPETGAEKLLRRAYDDTVEAVMNGASLPDPLPEITHQPAAPKARTPEVARAAIDEILTMLKPAADAEPETPNG